MQSPLISDRVGLCTHSFCSPSVRYSKIETENLEGRDQGARHSWWQPGVLPTPTMVDEEVKAPEGSVCPAHNRCRCQGQELEHLQEAWG